MIISPPGHASKTYFTNAAEKTVMVRTPFRRGHVHAECEAFDIVTVSPEVRYEPAVEGTESVIFVASGSATVAIVTVSGTNEHKVESGDVVSIGDTSGAPQVSTNSGCVLLWFSLHSRRVTEHLPPRRPSRDNGTEE
ncbi:hypothetical protein ACIHDR_49215 [Nocardia sp. NPDC052278]|uniref:hypothetical protein n=1 Tax=unclassified Nocardia TaxID=2637762 RepID=UPI0036B8545C